MDGRERIEHYGKGGMEGAQTRTKGSVERDEWTSGKEDWTKRKG